MSKLKVCKDCGAKISRSAKNCPNCGKRLKHTGLTTVLIILVILLGVGVATSINDTTNPTSSQTSENTKATLEKFNQIQTGVTYQEVVELMGEEGTLSTESSYGDQTMQIYYWYAKNGISNATVSFQNEKVTAKSQIGLE